ncbi:hypothetical protein [Aurantimonas sp. HBX-1]|uniref:hypothetical protein n=1 Tax=Aurantimonas sp. HBX-1 TaxID=2906072 RepID=UPI001F1DB167|nr:hypothetical protein [Aurantimonas sp. HBX-1]UIJ71917.1 hypothetical protein LXB15_19915 [Aurantimonas sp. HBX-1]
MLAFDYSIVTEWEKRTDVKVTELARKLVDHHPSTADRAGRESVIRDLARKFKVHKAALLAAHSFDAGEDPEAFFSSIRSVLEAFESLGIPVDRGVLPPGYRQGR